MDLPRDVIAVIGRFLPPRDFLNYRTLCKQTSEVDVRCANEGVRRDLFLNAARVGNIDAVRELISVGDTKIHAEEAVRRASEYGHTDIVKFLLQRERVKPSIYNLAFCEAVTNGHFGIVRLLLEYGVDPTACENYAIVKASMLGHIEIVKCLLESDLVSRDPDACGESVLLANMNDVSTNIIHTAIEMGHNDVVRVLLTCGKMDAVVIKNHTLWLAAYQGNIEIVRLLLDVGAGPMNEAIQMARKRGHDEILTLLHTVIIKWRRIPD